MFVTIIFSCKQNNETKKTPEKGNTAINDTLTKNLKSAFEKDAIIGFSVSVVDDKGLIYENSFGYTDIELKKKYTPNTTQNIGSISKTLLKPSLHFPPACSANNAIGLHSYSKRSFPFGD